MVFFYFSGTGNSKFIAEYFSEKMNLECYSIEEKIDFEKHIEQNETIGFCYPIYGSCVPKIMRDFTVNIMQYLKDKKIIIFCTQFIFSGNGARAFMELLPLHYVEVIYAEHFIMPNNICNFFPLPVTNGKKSDKYVLKAKRKVDNACKNITNGIIKKRGFCIGSRLLGLMQAAHFPHMEQKASKDVRIDSDCNGCGLCVSICPMCNLYISDGKAAQKGNCTLCYRCVNQCPNRAITAFVHKKVKKQYKGI